MAGLFPDNDQQAGSSPQQITGGGSDALFPNVSQTASTGSGADVRVNGNTVPSADFINSDDISWTINGSNVTAQYVAGSIAEADLNGALAAKINRRIRVPDLDSESLITSTETWVADDNHIATTSAIQNRILALVTTDEHIQDVVGAMVSSNIETRISVTYNDTNGTLNFVVDATDLGSSMAETGEDVSITISSTTGQDTTFSVTQTTTIDPSINSGELALSVRDASINTAQLTDGGVSTAKLSDGAVQTAKIGNDQVTSAKIATNGVVTSNITDANVTNAKLQHSTITINGVTVALGTSATIPTGGGPNPPVDQSPLNLGVQPNEVTYAGSGTTTVTATLTVDSGFSLNAGTTSVSASDTSNHPITVTRVSDTSFTFPVQRSEVGSIHVAASGTVTQSSDDSESTHTVTTTIHVDRPWYSSISATQPSNVSSMTDNGVLANDEETTYTTTGNASAHLYIALVTRSGGYEFKSGELYLTATNVGTVSSAWTLYRIDDFDNTSTGDTLSISIVEA